MDGEFWAELDAAVAVERGLVEGAAFSCEELAQGAGGGGEAPGDGPGAQPAWVQGQVGG